MTSTVIEQINNLLKKANYETFLLGSFATTKSKFCFDLIVKKDDQIFSVKVFRNGRKKIIPGNNFKSVISN